MLTRVSSVSKPDRNTQIFQRTPNPDNNFSATLGGGELISLWKRTILASKCFSLFCAPLRMENSRGQGSLSTVGESCNWRKLIEIPVNSIRTGQCDTHTEASACAKTRKANIAEFPTLWRVAGVPFVLTNRRIATGRESCEDERPHQHWQRASPPNVNNTMESKIKTTQAPLNLGRPIKTRLQTKRCSKRCSHFFVLMGGRLVCEYRTDLPVWCRLAEVNFGALFC